MTNLNPNLSGSANDMRVAMKLEKNNINVASSTTSNSLPINVTSEVVNAPAETVRAYALGNAAEASSGAQKIIEQGQGLYKEFKPLLWGTFLNGTQQENLKPDVIPCRINRIIKWGQEDSEAKFDITKHFNPKNGESWLVYSKDGKNLLATMEDSNELTTVIFKKDSNLAEYVGKYELSTKKLPGFVSYGHVKWIESGPYGIPELAKDNLYYRNTTLAKLHGLSQMHPTTYERDAFRSNEYTFWTDVYEGDYKHSKIISVSQNIKGEKGFSYNVSYLNKAGEVAGHDIVHSSGRISGKLKNGKVNLFADSAMFEDGGWSMAEFVAKHRAIRIKNAKAAFVPPVPKNEPQAIKIVPKSTNKIIEKLGIFLKKCYKHIRV